MNDSNDIYGTAIAMTILVPLFFIFLNIAIRLKTSAQDGEEEDDEEDGYQ